MIRWTVSLIVTIALISTGCKSTGSTKTMSLRLTKRSTSYKQLVWIKDYYSDDKLKSKLFLYRQSNCWGGHTFYSKDKEYFENGKLKQKTVSKAKKKKEKEFYSNGKLKSRTVAHLQSTVADSTDNKQIWQITTLLIDSVSGQRTQTTKLDTFSSIKIKF